MTDLVINVLNFIYGFVLKILPDFSEINSVFSNAENYMSTLIDFLKNINFIVPLPTIAIIVGIEVSIHIATFVFFVGSKIAKTVLSLIP